MQNKNYFQIVSGVGVQGIRFSHVYAAQLHDFKYVISVFFFNKLNVHEQVRMSIDYMRFNNNRSLCFQLLISGHLFINIESLNIINKNMSEENHTANLWSVQIRIGKCNINLKTEGAYAVSLKINKFLSNISSFNNVDANSSIHFNTTLKMNVQKQFIEDNQNCSIILHFQKEGNFGKDKKIIGMASLSVLKQNNNGFKFYGFGQCADNQAQVEASVNYYQYPLPISRNCNYVMPSYSSNSQLYDLQRSRGVQSSFEQFKDQQTDFTKQQKAYSQIGSNQRNYKKRKYQSQIKSKYYSRIKEAKKQGDPEEIITVLQTQIDQLNGSIQQFVEKEEKISHWKKDMKEIILELQAQNQLLKQIKIQELYEYNVQNMEEGIKSISKFVRQKFQKSKLQHKSTILIADSRKNKDLAKTKSWTQLPKLDQNQEDFPVQQKQKDDRIASNMQNWKKQFKVPDKKLQELEEEIFKISKERNQLYEISEELYKELKQCKQQRDKYLSEIREIQLINNQNLEVGELKETIESLKQQIQLINFQLKSYTTLDSSTEIRKLSQQNKRLSSQSKQLQRRIIQSFKAIEQFKNDALKAREQILDKEHQLQNYKSVITALKFKKENVSSQDSESLKQNSNISTELINMKNSGFVNGNQNQISKKQIDNYTSLLQNSIQSRKNILQHLQKTFRADSIKDFTAQNDLDNNRTKIAQLKNQINKLFIQIIKGQKRNQSQNNTKILQSKKIVASILSSLSST